MTPAQCRMARAGLDWSVRRLAEEAGVGRNTVTRHERGIVGTRPGSILQMRLALERAGIRFLDGPEPGVRLGSAASFTGAASGEGEGR